VSLSHLGPDGSARMVDVGAKPVTERSAVAEGAVRMSAAAFELVRTDAVEKGDVLGVARLAGIQAAKRTAELIPLCHTLGLDQIDVSASLDPARRAELGALLQELQRQRRTLVIATHDEDFADDFATRVVRLRDGALA